MPFPCGQEWTGTTRDSHSPSSKAVDWNRADDLGDQVVAAAPGVVTTAVPNGTSGYGRTVRIEHDERRDHDLRAPDLGRGGGRPVARPGRPCSAPSGETGNATGAAPALRGAQRRRHGGRAVLRRGEVRLRQHARLAQLRRRARRRQLRRRTRGGGRPSSAGSTAATFRFARTVRGSAEDPEARHEHRPAGRRGLGRHGRVNPGRPDPGHQDLPAQDAGRRSSTIRVRQPSPTCRSRATGTATGSGRSASRKAGKGNASGCAPPTAP